MLLELHIKDYALVDEAVLEFGPGFNVLTGETGAGKSLIIGAVTLLLGGRGATEQIRTGCSEASVHGVFSVSKEGALAKHLSGLVLIWAMIHINHILHHIRIRQKPTKSKRQSGDSGYAC